MAGEHDRKRVPVHHRADGARRARPLGLCREPPVRGDLSVGHVRELVEHSTVERRDPLEVELEVECLPPALEVLVELAARVVERRTQDADAEASREPFDVALGLGVVRDPAQPAWRRGEEQRPEWRVEEVVGDVEQARRRGGGAEAAVEAVGNGGHWSSFRRRRRIPEEAAWRAASAFEPSAAPMSS